MRPTETSYLLAVSSKDYRDCHQLAQDEGFDGGHSFSFPTVVARRNGELAGFFATQPADNAVIAGPLVVRGRRNPILAMRLIEAYDRVMRMHGIRLYYFSVAKDRADALSRERLTSLGMRYWEDVDDVFWFKKEL